MADAFFVFWILADADIELVFPNDGSGQEVNARAGAAEFVGRLARIAKELPNDVARFWLETVQIAVAAGEDDLGLAARLGINRVRPLSVHDLLAGIILLPDQFAGLLVETDEAGRAWRPDLEVPLVHGA